MIKTRLLALVVALSVLSGCGYTYHFRNNTAQRGDEHNEWASYFFFGLVGDHEIDVREFCPQGAYEITTGTNFLTWLVSGITIGIYTPRKVNIWCHAGPQPVAFEVDFGADGAPTRVTRRVAQASTSGDVKPVEGGYSVLLRKGDDR